MELVHAQLEIFVANRLEIFGQIFVKKIYLLFRAQLQRHRDLFLEGPTEASLAFHHFRKRARANAKLLREGALAPAWILELAFLKLLVKQVGYLIGFHLHEIYLVQRPFRRQTNKERGAPALEHYASNLEH